ncbi:MAG TPA: GNAT family N-acetyltransferase [Vicinamibacterales bacterium]|nr:GNAT family N-acetyltransferase [Vicinamibacterales bacterium]
MIEIRTAAVTDAQALAELRWEFRSVQDPATEPHDDFVRRCAEWMRRELSIGGSWQVWVAVDRNAIVGQVWVQTVGKIPNPVADSEPEHIAYLSNLFVKVSARGGAGTRLLETALDWCRANRMDRVVLWPSRRSVTLYLGHGFSSGGEVMELKIRR